MGRAIRLTNTGTLITSGQFNEVDVGSIKFTNDFVHADEIDEVTGCPVEMRIPSTLDILRVSNEFDEITALPSTSTGGTITYYSPSETTTYQIHSFSTSGSFTFSLDEDRTVEYLIVGGGGGGGTGLYNPTYRGYPGYGGNVTSGTASLTAGNYSVIVGNGGAGGVNQPLYPQNNRFYGLPGGDSSFNGVISTGGIGGQTANTANPPSPPDNSVSSNITGTAVSYGLPGAVTTPSAVGQSGVLPGEGGDGGGLGNFSGGRGKSGIVIVRYLIS